MIAKLSGRVDSVGLDWVIIDVGGVGYLAYCSSRTLSSFGVGMAVSLMIETHVREDHIHLYGFADADELDWFRLLTTVQGVGAKVGLGILSVLEPVDLLRAIVSGDKAALGRASGVGPKLANRILTELKDKAGNMALGQVGTRSATGGPEGHSPVVPGGVRGEITDAVSALVNLGYSPSDALGVVSRAAGDLGDEAPVEQLIRAGLAALAPSDSAAERRQGQR
ncbi:MAG: Holliday junction branch migration protein RuvA [Rhodospirillales bacterium]